MHQLGSVSISLSPPLLSINVTSCDYNWIMSKTQAYHEKLNKRPRTNPGNLIHARRCGVKQRYHSWWDYCTYMCKWYKCLLQTDPYWFPLSFSFLLLSMQWVYEKERGVCGEVTHRACEIITLLPALNSQGGVAPVVELQVQCTPLPQEFMRNLGRSHLVVQESKGSTEIQNSMASENICSY